MLKVYVTDLASYNSGYLIGEFCTLPMDKTELDAKVAEILAKGAKACGETEHEEYFITDYEFEGTKLFKVEEYSNLDELNEKCEQIADLSDEDQRKVAYLMDYVGFDFDDALERYEDVTIYESTTLKEIAEDFIYETVDMDSLPDIIRNNIDFDGIAVDLDISGEYDSVDGDIFHFVN